MCTHTIRIEQIIIIKKNKTVCIFENPDSTFDRTILYSTVLRRIFIYLFFFEIFEIPTQTIFSIFFFPCHFYTTAETRLKFENKKNENFLVLSTGGFFFFFWRSRYVFGRRRFARVLRQHCVCGRPAVRGRRQKPERSQCVAPATDSNVPPPHARDYAAARSE